MKKQKDNPGISHLPPDEEASQRRLDASILKEALFLEEMDAQALETPEPEETPSRRKLKRELEEELQKISGFTTSPKAVFPPQRPLTVSMPSRTYILFFVFSVFFLLPQRLPDSPESFASTHGKKIRFSALTFSWGSVRTSGKLC